MFQNPVKSSPRPTCVSWPRHACPGKDMHDLARTCMAWPGHACPGLAMHVLACPGAYTTSWRVLALHGASWRVLAHPNTSRSSTTRQDVLPAWTCSGSSWIILDLPGSAWIILDHPGLSWTSLDLFWIILDHYGPAWT